MAATFFKTDLSKFAFLPSVRADVNFHFFFDVENANVWPNSSVELSQILIPVKSEKIEKGELEFEEKLIDLANIDRRYNQLINLCDVSEIGSDKNVLSEGDIVIPKIQPRMGNIFLNLEHKRYLGSSELIEYRIKEGTYNPKFFYYLITHPQFAKCLYYTESGKTHRRVNPTELLKYKIPFVRMEVQNEALSKIEPIENKIKEYRSTLRKDQDIINSVIIRAFNLDIERLCRIDETHHFVFPFSMLSSSNYGIRDSVRYSKLQILEEAMLSHFGDFDSLDNFLCDVKTKNGWSPENNEIEGNSKILGIDSLHFNGVLTTDNPKYTNETRKDIDKFIIHEGDFFISRGNTVDLVALASVAQDIEEDFIFPDIMIKLFVDENKIDKMFLAYLFNSIIGRLYFKYASKGKQQTMVKVSSDTIRKFLIPKIMMSKQVDIVNEIREETGKQINVHKAISLLRSEIDFIISEAIK